MYSFDTPEQMQAYRDALDSHGVQYLYGLVKPLNSEEFYIDSSGGHRIKGTPRYERRCTESENAFMFGQIYSGSMEIEFEGGDIRAVNLAGAEVILWFSPGGYDVRIKLGTWEVTQPERVDAHTVRLKCSDCVNRLNVAINDPSVGWISLATRMRVITQLTGVRFAQTAEEIGELAGYEELLAETSFAENCRREITQIAELIGGFAFANRENKIEFRRFSSEPCLTVTADLRHSSRLNEYTYSVGGIGYISANGDVCETYFDIQENADITQILSVSGNEIIGSSITEEQWDYYARYIKNGLAGLPAWTPGELDYYGDPSLDIGDMILLSGGSAGQTAKFLITADYWQFRGAQTLISAGAGQFSGSAGGGSSSSSGSAATTTNIITQRIVNTVVESLVPLTRDDDEIRTGLTQRLSGAFSCRESTLATVCVSAVVRAQKDTEAELHVLIDGVMNSIIARESVTEGSYRTLTASVPFKAGSGSHTVTAETSGSIEIDRISGYIRGQGITEEQYAPMLDDDFEYTVSNGKATVTGYRGDAARVRIPAKLGGNPVTAIASGAFAGRDGITAVKIPDGVEAIG